MGTDSEHKQPKSILYHSVDWSDWLMQRMGMINAQEMYSNEFLRMKDVWFMLKTIEESIKQGVIDLKEKPELHLNTEAMYRLDKVYNGTCYLEILRNDYGTKVNARKFHYRVPEEKQNQEIIKLPALKHLNPVGSITQDIWGIRIRESVPFRYAFEDCNYSTIISEGGFVHKFSDGISPKFQMSDMESLEKKTYVVSREYYNKTVDVLNKFWQKQWYILSINTHKIIQHMKMGNFQKEDSVKKVLVGSD